MTDTNSPNSQSFTRIQILAFMGVTAVILLTIAQIWRTFASIRIVPVEFNITAIFLGIIIAFGIIVATSILDATLESYRRSAEDYLELIVTPLVFPDLIWLGLLPGLSEELLFRGVMIPAFGYDLFAIIVSSILFGVLHLSDKQNWYYVLWAIVIGLILGYSVYFTNNLLVPILAHSLINFFSGLIWKIKKRMINTK
ncbi:MAG: CPBP family intramembrane metalloprotease [Geminocystis sp. GBBB08]|nr:CPBP family intramembrane metalloprotease [Geminocystis sp. GBBB08]